MVFPGYLTMGGREIVNGGRTFAYATTMLPNLHVEACADCDGLYEVLGDKVYTSPLVDQPDWFDVDNPDTWDFYGLYPISFDGFEDATTTATVTEYINDGGAISSPRRGTRSVRITGLMLGMTPQAVSAGMTWLRSALRPGGCGVNRSCGGDHMSYFVACPPLCEDSPDLVVAPTGTELRECATGAIVGPISACALPFERHLYNSVCVDGPRIIEEYSPTCGSMVMVEFTIVSGVPSPFGTARQVADLAVDPDTLPTVPDRTCGDDDLSEILQRTNVAPNPGPTDLSTTSGWGPLGGAIGPYNASWDNTVVHTAGGTSRKTTRKQAGTGTAASSLGAIQRVGGFGALTDAQPSLPPASPNLTMTASLWMRSSVEGTARISVLYIGADGRNLGGGEIFGPEVPAPANTWVRAVTTFTPPAAATNLWIYAYMVTADGSAAPANAAVWYTESLIEVSPGPLAYFDGNTVSTDSTITYSWLGEIGRSTSRVVEIREPGPILDPDCPPIPDAPRPPPVQESCVVPVDSYKRFTVAIPADVVPRWSDLVPIISLTTAAEAVRQLRVRFYANPAERPQYELEQCGYVGEFIVSYLPPNSTMVIDGITHDVVVLGPTGLPQAASHLLYGSGGGPMAWPYMSCGYRYDIAVDVAPAVVGLQFELCVAARE